MSIAFSEINWTRFDWWAVVACRGVAVVDAMQSQSYRSWLERHEYGIISLDFGSGLDRAVRVLGKLLRWEEQFGYTLAADSRNLDAMRDGFEFAMKPGSGAVLELLNADAAHSEDP